MLWWISWTRFVLATVSRYYLKNTMIDKKKINPRLFFILPSSKNFLLRLGCFLVNILLRGWKFPEFCLETNTNRTQYNCFINTDRLPFQILRLRLTFLREILGLQRKMADELDMTNRDPNNLNSHLGVSPFLFVSCVLDDMQPLNYLTCYHFFKF